MNIASGIKLLEQREGEGKSARAGDRVVYNLKIFLNKGDEVPLNRLQTEMLPRHMIRTVEDYDFVEHKIILGKREAIAAVERTLIGMKEGGFRKVRASPHMAYREKGIPDLIPKNAVLVLEIWLRGIIAKA